MKIKCKSDDLLNALRRMSRIATERFYNYRLAAKDILEIYAQSSSMYSRIVIIEAEVLEAGECLLPTTALTLLPPHRDIVLEVKGESVKVTSGKTSINIKMTYEEPDIIPVIKDEIAWSKKNHERLPILGYATKPDLNYTSCIWFMDGGAIASDGINTVTYRVEEDLPVSSLGLDASLLNRFNFESEFHIATDKNSIWLGSSIGYAVVQGSELVMPEVLKQFIGVTENELSSIFVVNMDEIKSFLPSILKLSESKDKFLCVLAANGDNLSIIPQGNEIGNGDYNFTVLESINSMMVAVNPKALVKTLSNCGKGVRTLGMYDVPGFTSMLTVLDDEITHFITPMKM